MLKMLKQVEGVNKTYLGEKEIWNTYKNEHNINAVDFKLILRSFFAMLSYSAVNTGNIYTLPKKLGTYSVRKKDTFGRGRFNYKLFKETGVKQWKKNPHSSGYTAVFKWDTSWLRWDQSLPSHVMKLKPPRDVLRYLAKKIIEDNTIHKYYDY